MLILKCPLYTDLIHQWKEHSSKTETNVNNTEGQDGTRVVSKTEHIETVKNKEDEADKSLTFSESILDKYL